MKKIRNTVLFSSLISLIFLIPNSTIANNTDTKIINESTNFEKLKGVEKQNAIMEKLKEFQKRQLIDGMEKHNAISSTSVLTDREGNILHTIEITYKNDK